MSGKDAHAVKYHLNHTQRARAAQDMRVAADLIEKHGWTQGKAMDDQGHICVGEALYRASGEAASEALHLNSRYNLSMIALGKYVGTLAMAWNDTVGESEGSILTTMRLCADWLDKLAEEA